MRSHGNSGVYSNLHAVRICGWVSVGRRSKIAFVSELHGIYENEAEYTSGAAYHKSTNAYRKST
jgi:hypothetical protein